MTQFAHKFRDEFIAVETQIVDLCSTIIKEARIGEEVPINETNELRRLAIETYESLCSLDCDEGDGHVRAWKLLERLEHSTNQYRRTVSERLKSTAEIHWFDPDAEGALDATLALMESNLRERKLTDIRRTSPRVFMPASAWGDRCDLTVRPDPFGGGTFGYSELCSEKNEYCHFTAVEPALERLGFFPIFHKSWYKSGSRPSENEVKEKLLAARKERYEPLFVAETYHDYGGRQLDFQTPRLDTAALLKFGEAVLRAVQSSSRDERFIKEVREALQGREGQGPDPLPPHRGEKYLTHGGIIVELSSTRKSPDGDRTLVLANSYFSATGLTEHFVRGTITHDEWKRYAVIASDVTALIGEIANRKLKIIALRSDDDPYGFSEKLYEGLAAQNPPFTVLLVDAADSRNVRILKSTDAANFAAGDQIRCTRSRDNGE